MDRRQPADHRVILDRHMARERRDIGHDDAMAERAIMRDVAIGENMIVRAYARDFAVTGRAVNRDIFAKRVPVADFRARDAAFPFQILRLQSNARERKNFISFSQLRVAINNDMRMKFTLLAQRDVFADHAVRPDLAAGAEFRLGMDDCGRMDHFRYRAA